jgi:hypothetical protein
MMLEGSLGTAATCGKEEVNGRPEHLAARMASHRRGRGNSGVETIGNTQTGPVRKARPLKARGAIAFSRRVVLGVQRPPTGGPRRWKRSLTSGPAPI